MSDARTRPGYGERIARLEERVTNLTEDARALGVDVGELARARVAAEAIAREATSRAFLKVRSRELVIAAVGLALTAANVAVAVWGS